MSVIAPSAQEAQVFDTVAEAVRKVVVHRLPLALVAGGMGITEADLAHALDRHLAIWRTRIAVAATASTDLASCLEAPG